MKAQLCSSLPSLDPKSEVVFAGLFTESEMPSSESKLDIANESKIDDDFLRVEKESEFSLRNLLFQDRPMNTLRGILEKPA